MPPDNYIRQECYNRAERTYRTHASQCLPLFYFDASRQSFRMEGFDRLSIDTSAQLDHTLRLKVILLTKNP